MTVARDGRCWFAGCWEQESYIAYLYNRLMAHCPEHDSNSPNWVVEGVNHLVYVNNLEDQKAREQRNV